MLYKILLKCNWNTKYQLLLKSVFQLLLFNYFEGKTKIQNTFPKVFQIPKYFFDVYYNKLEQSIILLLFSQYHANVSYTRTTCFLISPVACYRRTRLLSEVAKFRLLYQTVCSVLHCESSRQNWTSVQLVQMTVSWCCI